MRIVPHGVPGRTNTVASIVGRAEEEFEIPIIDRIGSKGNFSFNLKWDNKSTTRLKNFEQALNDQLGLDLVPGATPMEMLFVEKAK